MATDLFKGFREECGRVLEEFLRWLAQHREVLHTKLIFCLPVERGLAAQLKTWLDEQERLFRLDPTDDEHLGEDDEVLRLRKSLAAGNTTHEAEFLVQQLLHIDIVLDNDVEHKDGDQLKGGLYDALVDFLGHNPEDIDPKN
jgi:hypothetical protein